MEDVKNLLDGIEEPDWIKDSNWRSNPNNGIKEARLWNTIPKKLKYIPNPGELKPIIEYKSFEPEFISEEIKHDPKAPKVVLIDYQSMLGAMASLATCYSQIEK